MKLTKFLKLNLFVSSLCSILGISLAIPGPDYTEHYKIVNSSSSVINNLVISDFLHERSDMTGGLYHDQVLNVNNLSLNQIEPSSGPGGLFSFMNTNYHWNGWDISYCDKIKCYKSDISLHLCSLTSDDIFSGATSTVIIKDNGKVTIQKPRSGSCDFDLEKPGTNPYSPTYTEHYKVRNDSQSQSPITNLVISDYTELGDEDGFYHDPVITSSVLNYNDIAPSSGLGGLVSYSDTNSVLDPFGWNGWDIHYCTPYNCYKSDMSVHSCSMKDADIFSGSTAMISIEDNGLVTIYMASQAKCILQLNIDSTKFSN